MRKLTSLIGVGLALAVLANTAWCQVPYRMHSHVLSAFRDVVSEPSKSTVQVFSDGYKSSLGAIVGKDGYVLTKASELKGKIECQFHDGKRMEAQIVGKEPGMDLALLKVDAHDLPEITWNEAASLPVGSWLATPGLNRDPVAIGVLSVEPRKIPAPSGAMGVQLDMNDARIIQVMPGSAAEKAGLLAQDLVLKVNGKEVKGRQELVDTIRAFQPGEKVDLLVQRGSDELAVTVTLGSLAQIFQGEGHNRAEFQNNLGSQLSERRAGFPSVIQHDTVLKPSECGGPLVDLDGKVVGINIARAGRVESYALPTAVVKSVLADLISGKLAPKLAPEKVADMVKPVAEPAKKVQ